MNLTLILTNLNIYINYIDIILILDMKAVETIKMAIFIISAYLTYFSYKGYKQSSQYPAPSFKYWHQSISFLASWSSKQFQQNTRHQQLQYSISQQDSSITVQLSSSKNIQKLVITYQNLEIENQDAKYISNVYLLSKQFQIYIIKSAYYTLVYNANDKIVCYSRIHLQERIEEKLFVDSAGKLWVFTYPNYNIIIYRIFSTTQRKQLHRNRYPLKQKVQLISSIIEQKQKIMVKMLTYNRNTLILQFNLATNDLHSKQDIKSHTISYFTEDISDMTIKISQKIIQTEIYTEIMSILYRASFGYLGQSYQSSKYENMSKIQNKGKFRVREKQVDYEVQAFDMENNVMFQINQFNNVSQVVGFGEVLVPTRTPVFISKRDKEELVPFDVVLNKSKNQQVLPSVDFKVYGIKSKNLQILKDRTGLYRILPDSSVHFMTFNKNYLSFYPKQNIKSQQYYAIRIGRGGITMMGQQIKGIFQQTPVNDPKAIELNFGYVKDEVYHEHTTNGAQVAPSIYQAHAAHKGLFTKTYKGRIDLITSLSGKSIMSHYLSKKQGYQYSTSFIQNNQFWVFQHKHSTQPLITKYQLFVNASSPKTLLSIKRTYTIPTKGRIIGIQKCIDFFYYIDYVTEQGKYGIARVHHVLFSNRQVSPDGKYSGAFQKMMIIPNISRNTKLVVTAEEEQMLCVEIGINGSVVQNWNKLQLKHQYKILPIRVFAYKNNYYVFNVRKIMVNAFDKELYQIGVDLYTKVFVICSSLALVALLLIAIAYKNKAEAVPQKSGSDPAKKQDIKQEGKERKQQKKKQKKNN